MSILASSSGQTTGLDCTSCQLSSTCIFFVCLGPPSNLLFVPMIHVSHVHPPLTTIWLNTNTQVNNMTMLHLIYIGHTYVHHIIINIQLFLHTSILLGRLAPSHQEQLMASFSAAHRIRYCNPLQVASFCIKIILS
jgi:hypothetical protein